MPKPPFPNAGRAVVGFVFGLVLTAIIVGLVRWLVWGLDVYFIPTLTSGWFWDDQATFMFVMLGGALGFLWGAGAVYDFAEEGMDGGGEVKALAAPRIPLDPDAPQDVTNPLVALMPAFGGITFVVVILAICILWIVAVIQLSAIPVGFTVLGLVAISAGLRLAMGEKVSFSTNSLVIIGLLTLMGFGMDANVLPNIFPSEARTQLSNPDAERTEFSEIDFNFVGLVELESTNKAYLFVFFSLFVLFNIVGIAATLGIVVYFLNKFILGAQAQPAQPLDDSQFFPLKIATFFTDWALDILNGVTASVRSR
jgi:hypothetical protein